MAKVKIWLEDQETIQEAEENLFKALDLHNSGDIHSNQSFEDPAMVSVEQEMVRLHKNIYHDLLQEISEALDEDYKI